MSTNQDTYYPPTMTLSRDNYASEAEYRQAYRDCQKHCGYKVRVEGGWKFFESAEDLRIWRQQR